jgi:hypothetical protein
VTLFAFQPLAISGSTYALAELVDSAFAELPVAASFLLLFAAAKPGNESADKVNATKSAGAVIFFIT